MGGEHPPTPKAGDGAGWLLLVRAHKKIKKNLKYFFENIQDFSL